VTDTKHNEAQAIIEVVERLSTPKLVDIGQGRSVLLSAKGTDVSSVKDLLDEYRTRPERRSGTAKLEDLDSLVLFANRFKDDNSALFASLAGAPSLTAVIDYNERGAGDEKARYGTHTGVYTFPLSVEWRAWIANNGKAMGQSDFAEFIENRVADLDLEPKGDSVHFAERTKLAFASPSKMVELSRGITIRQNTSVKNVVNLSSGEVQLVYETAHVGGEDFGPLKVPGAFLIAVPVFERGEAFQVAARLRYRTKQGQVSWSYELYQADRRLQLAFDEACEAAAEQTGLPLFRGAPER
jgi:uncharacterized protein YfdQ (DUF2303 family)